MLDLVISHGHITRDLGAGDTGNLHTLHPEGVVRRGLVVVIRHGSDSCDLGAVHHEGVVCSKL